MKRQTEQLEFDIMGASFFGLSIVLLVCVFKWDSFASCFQKLKRCCCRRRSPVNVQEYRDLNELLFDVDDPERVAGRLAVEEDENPRELSMESFFPDILGGKSFNKLSKKPSVENSREPLL